MRSRFYTGLRDVQQDSPVSYCPRCGGEIYHYEEVSELDGGFFHDHCMTEWEQEDYPTYPACSFFDEEC